MKTSVVMILLCFLHFHVQSSHQIEREINRYRFPEAFIFGISTSLYQVCPSNFLRYLNNYETQKNEYLKEVINNYET